MLQVNPSTLGDAAIAAAIARERDRQKANQAVFLALSPKSAKE